MTTSKRCPHCNGRIINYGIDLVCENDWYNISTREHGSCPESMKSLRQAVKHVTSPQNEMIARILKLERKCEDQQREIEKLQSKTTLHNSLL